MRIPSRAGRIRPASNIQNQPQDMENTLAAPAARTRRTFSPILILDIGDGRFDEAPRAVPFQGRRLLLGASTDSLMWRMPEERARAVSSARLASCLESPCRTILASPYRSPKGCRCEILAAGERRRHNPSGPIPKSATPIVLKKGLIHTNPMVVNRRSVGING